MLRTNEQKERLVRGGGLIIIQRSMFLKREEAEAPKEEKATLEPPTHHGIAPRGLVPNLMGKFLKYCTGHMIKECKKLKWKVEHGLATNTSASRKFFTRRWR